MAVPFAVLLAAFASARTALRSRSRALRRAFLRRVAAWFSILWSSRVRRLPIVNPFRLGLLFVFCRYFESNIIHWRKQSCNTYLHKSGGGYCGDEYPVRKYVLGKMLTNPDQSRIILP